MRLVFVNSVAFAHDVIPYVLLKATYIFCLLSVLSSLATPLYGAVASHLVVRPLQLQIVLVLDLMALL